MNNETSLLEQVYAPIFEDSLSQNAPLVDEPQRLKDTKF